MLGGVVIGARILSGEDGWLCQANAWVVHGKPSEGVPSAPCNGTQTVYLDVRTQEEWDAGHIKGAVHMDLARLQAGELPNISQDANVQVYCRSGNRARAAVQILEGQGFRSVVNRGGLEGLHSEGYPLE